MILSAGANAMTLCTKTEKICEIYGELKKEGPTLTQFDIQSNNKVLYSLDSYRGDDWAILKDNEGKYFLRHLIRHENKIAIFVHELSIPCSLCEPELLSGRYIIDAEMFIEKDRRPQYFGTLAVDKIFSKGYQLSNEEVGSAIELGEFDDMYDSPTLDTKYQNTGNIFFVKKYSKTNEFLHKKLLYLPPYKNETTFYLYAGCLEGCGFSDSVLQKGETSYTLFGSINNTIPVKFNLTKKDNIITGEYCYLKNCKQSLSLSGNIKDGVMVLEERDKNKLTGAMKLKIEGNTLSGEWTSTKGKKMPIFLVREER